MSTQSTGEGPPAEGHSRPGSAGRPQTKIEAQVRLIIAAMRERGIEVASWPPLGDNGEDELDYLFEVNVILVRDAYLARVEALLFGPGQPGEPGRDQGDDQRGDQRREEERGRRPRGFLEGVTLLSLRGRYSVQEALELIDSEIGVGVATPNHVLSITPVTCCPATEPEPVPATAQPDPGVCDAGGSGVSIYVTDTGLLPDAATRHPWLAGVTGEPDLLQGGNIEEYTGHGTFVAGVARCMAPVASVRVTDDFTAGGALTEHEIVLKLAEGLAEAPDVISLSAGGSTRKNLPMLGFEAFWNRYRHYKNVVLVAAAGNNASRRPFWPAAFPQVVSVGALSADYRARAHFSDFGSWVDVYAPGENLVNAYATGRYTYREPPHRNSQRLFHGMARWSGTSFATPLVAGLIAARVSRTGETARQAAGALLAHARAERVPGVGPVLLPCVTGDRAPRGCGCGCCGCRG
jgi:subtilisin family serine protease